MGTTYLPEARRQIVKAMTEAQMSWADTVLQESFRDPADAVNIELFIEAQIGAVTTLLATHPSRAALLETFALGLLDATYQSGGAQKMTLTKRQQAFLEKHEIPLWAVFNAKGLVKREYQEAMRAMGAIVAYNVSPCGLKGHRLRTRHGHCVQCSPESLSYFYRFIRPGTVYMAESRSSRLFKIGLSNNPRARVRVLSQEQYGEASDWKLLYSVYCENAGRIEALVHRILDDHKVERDYLKNGKWIRCREVFKCTYQDASLAFDYALGQSGLGDYYTED